MCLFLLRGFFFRTFFASTGVDFVRPAAVEVGAAGAVEAAKTGLTRAAVMNRVASFFKGDSGRVPARLEGNPPFAWLLQPCNNKYIFNYIRFIHFRLGRFFTT